MCITNLFQKPSKVIDRQKIVKDINSNEHLKAENFKYSLRNDKVHLRDYYFRGCLEQIVMYCSLHSISDVQVIWPNAEIQINKREQNLKNVLKHFSFSLWQNNIKCTIINQPEIEYDAVILATLQIIESASATNNQFYFEAENF